MNTALNRSRTPHVDRELRCFYGGELIFYSFRCEGGGLATALDTRFLLVDSGDFTRWRYKPVGDSVGTIVVATVIED
jgi:hypothetical protein